MQYDVFISYKHSDIEGNLTRDFEMAKQLYNALNQMGLSVFFSAKSLEQIGSSRYKADIDEALDNTTIMIVVLSLPEHANTQWVKYEWDSFYNDFLSGLRKEANLFTLTDCFDIAALPRTLRNLQHFYFREGVSRVCDYIRKIIPNKCMSISTNNKQEDNNNESSQQHFQVLSGQEITRNDIEQACLLDKMVYSADLRVEPQDCEKWFKVNPDIYVMIRDISKRMIIGYINVAPVTDECYDMFKSGAFVDTGLTSEMILSYDMPFPYSVYFTSIVIHPDYQNSEVFMKLFSAIVDKFIWLGRHEVYVKRMIADAVSENGIKFCKLFGMNKIKNSNHNSSLYEVSMIPPKFRIISKKTKELFDYYQQKYFEESYLFDD